MSYFNLQFPVEEKETCNLCIAGKPRLMFKTKCNQTGEILSVSRCNICGVVYLYPKPKRSVGRDYFENAYNDQSDSPAHLYFSDEHKFEVAKVRLDWLESFNIPGKNILDIGCGMGHFLYVAKNRQWNVYGVELSENAISTAKERFGLNICHSVLTHRNISPESFDVVTLWDVIEHLDNPTETLKEVYNLLKRNGLIILRTANIDSWYYGANPKNWEMFFIDHMYYFSAKTINNLLIEAGFKDILIHFVEPENKKTYQVSDISSTSFVEGIKSVLLSPTKLRKIPLFLFKKLQYSYYKTRFPETYDIGIMTVLGKKR